MHTSVEDINSYSKKLTIEIAPEELQEIEKKIVKNYQKRAEMPGFRRGFAPAGLVRQRFKTNITQDIFDEALQTYYGKAIDESGIQPVSQGKITDLKYEKPETGMVLEMELEVEPQFELKKYKGLKVERDVFEVNDDVMDSTLSNLQEQYATVKEVEEAKNEDVVHFDAQELDEMNVPIVGRKYENLSVQLGSGRFDSHIEDQLIGIKKDEKRVVTQKAPELPDQKKTNLPESKLEIHAKKIEERDLPELNDDFVKNLAEENLDNMDQLKDRLRLNLEADFNRRSQESFSNRLIDELLKENPFEVPPSMVEHYLDDFIQDVKNRSKGQRIDEETFRKNYRPTAIHNIRWFFLKKKLVEAENLTVTNEEAIEQIEKEPGLDEKVKTQLKSDNHYLEHLKEDLLERKALDLLKDNAEVVDVYPQTAQIQNKEKESQPEKTSEIKEKTESKKE